MRLSRTAIIFAALFVANNALAEEKLADKKPAQGQAPIADTSKISTEENKYKLTEDEKTILDKSTLSFQANQLQDMYAQTALSNPTSFDRSYMIEQPLNMTEALDFRHPYLKILVSDLTEADRKAILESIQNEQTKYQRYKSIMVTAMKFATNAALYERTRKFHENLLKKRYGYMTQIFPFHALTLENGKIRAPVIEEIGFTQTIEDKRTRRDIKKRYRIKRQAEVINAPQTFMDFFGNLLTEKPKAPNVYMLPLNPEELEYWRKGILNGWGEGNRLANEIIRADLRAAMSEFTGQLRFHYLARAKIISRPTSQNITVGTNANGMSVNIGESLFEITQLPQFNDKELEWLALPQVDDIFDELTKEDVEALSMSVDHPGDLR